MCSFSKPVNVVANTNIFARAAKDGRQFLVCSMEFAADQDLAMTFTESEPEPDGAIVRGDERTFTSQRRGRSPLMGRSRTRSP